MQQSEFPVIFMGRKKDESNEDFISRLEENPQLAIVNNLAALTAATEKLVFMLTPKGNIVKPKGFNVK